MNTSKQYPETTINKTSAIICCLSTSGYANVGREKIMKNLGQIRHYVQWEKIVAEMLGVEE